MESEACCSPLALSVNLSQAHVYIQTDALMYMVCVYTSSYLYAHFIQSWTKYWTVASDHSASRHVVSNEDHDLNSTGPSGLVYTSRVSVQDTSPTISGGGLKDLITIF